jgi:hypothetical protein
MIFNLSTKLSSIASRSVRNPIDGQGQPFAAVRQQRQANEPGLQRCVRSMFHFIDVHDHSLTLTPSVATGPGRVGAIANSLRNAQALESDELQRMAEFETARKDILTRMDGDWLQVRTLVPASERVTKALFADDARHVRTGPIRPLASGNRGAPPPSQLQTTKRHRYFIVAVARSGKVGQSKELTRIVCCAGTWALAAGERNTIIDPEAFVLLRALLDFYKFAPGTATSQVHSRRSRLIALCALVRSCLIASRLAARSDSHQGLPSIPHPADSQH